MKNMRSAKLRLKLWERLLTASILHPRRKNLGYLLEDGKATIFVAENQEYVDRILPLLDELPFVKRIVVFDLRGMFTYDHPALVSFRELMERGEAEVKSRPTAVEEIARQVKPSDPLFIVYTSGTTGNPKGALMSHGKHLAAAYTLIDRYPLLARQPHRTVVYLPLCHVLGKDVAVTLPLLTKMVPHYGESIEDLAVTIFETAPTGPFTVPRYLQKFASNILVAIENSSRLKRGAYRLSVKIGRGYIGQRMGGQEESCTEASVLAVIRGRIPTHAQQNRL